MNILLTDPASVELSVWLKSRGEGQQPGEDKGFLQTFMTPLFPGMLHTTNIILYTINGYTKIMNSGISMLWVRLLTCTNRDVWLVEAAGTCCNLG